MLFASFDASIDEFVELGGEVLGFIELESPLGFDDFDASDDELVLGAELDDDGGVLVLDGGVAGMLLDDGGVAVEGGLDVSVFWQPTSAPSIRSAPSDAQALDLIDNLRVWIGTIST